MLLLQTVGPGNQFANAGEDGLLLYYPCDEKSGTVLHDAGPNKKDGSLNTILNGEERGVSIVCKKVGEWVPIINADGIQRKGIVPGSDSALAEGERPIVLDRDKDYAIDTTNGLIKALEGGRVELDKAFTLDFKFSNPGPQWTQGRTAGGLRLDGDDDFISLGDPPSADKLLSLTIELWVFLSHDLCSECPPPVAAVIEKGLGKQRFGIFLSRARPSFYHPYSSLHLLDETPRAPNTNTPGPSDDRLRYEKWSHVAATYDNGNSAVFLDGKEIYRSRSIPQPLETKGPFRIGGDRDPFFFGAIVDEIKIYNRAKTAEEIAKDASQ